MQRRNFLGVLGAMGMTQAATPPTKKTRFYLVEQYKMRSGAQPPRLHEFFSQTMLPALDKIHTGPKIFLNAEVAPHVPQAALIAGFSSLEEMGNVRAKMYADDAVNKKYTSLEGSAPIFDTLDSSVWQAADYSPEIVSSAADGPARLFEMRIYHAPTGRHLQGLHERFNGGEIGVFHRVGIHPILYASTMIGPDQPNLVYVIPFADLAAREKAWAAFGADPEWAKIRKESNDKYGAIPDVIQVSLWRATAY
ncbi:MAG TPA: NIPSNAP family protein [Bryobacteraceae bacterium]|nr:NIPSNAP family protein [Bryobacteraceae bacterium]